MHLPQRVQVCTVAQQADRAFLVGQAALADILDEPVEGKGEGTHGQLALHQLAGVEDVARVHAGLELAQGVHLALVQKGYFSDADAVFAGHRAAHFLGHGHGLHGGLLGLLHHKRVVGVDRNVHVTVAVARVHVAGHHDTAGAHVVRDLSDFGGQTVIVFVQAAQEVPGAGGQFVVRQARRGVVALRDARGQGEFAVEILVLQGKPGRRPTSCMAWR